MDNVHPKNTPKHPAPYLDAYCGQQKTAANPRGMGPSWCWWTRDDRCGPQFRVGYMPGDRLWVRERAHIDQQVNRFSSAVSYAADMPVGMDLAGLCYAPSIHMPRWASRLTLTVTDVRVQRLQDIGEEDAKAEGLTRAPGGWWSGAEGQAGYTPRAAYALLWNSLHDPDAWSANPWVAALTFIVERANIDALPSPVATEPHPCG